jgi:cytochrome c oxidase assembly factor CtaG
MRGMPRVTLSRRMGHAGIPARAIALASAAALLVAGPVAAHGPVPAEPPSAASLLFGWTVEPVPALGILAALLWWRWAVRRVDAAHPRTPVPRQRTAAFVAGMAAIAVALMSGIDRYDTTLFSVHMVQHILLTLVAAPLIALSAPITLVLRVASAATRRRWILPILHARLTRVLSFPVVAWLLFAAVMWGTHFSPMFDASLEDPLIHDLEHALYLGAGLLFWWPAVALDPAPWRMGHPVRALYTFLQMTQNTFLSVVLLNAQTVLYPHYATLVRSWGPTPLVDQQLAAGIMWVAGDLIFLTAIMATIVGWSRAEARDAQRADRQAAADLAEIRVREGRLAARRAREREDPQSGSGVAR